MNGISPRCCGVGGLFSDLVPVKKGRGGTRPGAGRKKGSKSRPAFVGPPNPRWCAKCGVMFFGKGTRCFACPVQCTHEKPVFGSGRPRNACYACSPRKSGGDFRADHRRVSTRVACCAECGADYEQWMPHTKYCSKLCSRTAGLRRMRERSKKITELASTRRDIKQCVVCGSGFRVGDRNRTLCCSPKCAEQRERIRKSGSTHKRRAIRFGCSYAPVDRLRVFERDKWRCQLCGMKVNAATAELDHIVPMSVGGSHSYENTQCACSRCNRTKGAKPMGQLHLAIAAGTNH